MREPQATSTLGTLRHTAGMMRRVRSPRRGLWLAALVLGFADASVLAGQIRGGRPAARQPRTGYWVSGGAAAVLLGTVNDGRTGTRWEFGSDPLWQFRGSLEKALDDESAVGIAVGFGRVDTRVEQFTPPMGQSVRDPDNPLPDECLTACDARTDLWSLLGTFHSGGGPGFHTLFEATGGVTSFRNLETRSDAQAIGPASGTIDLTGTLGAGFGYTLSSGMVVNLVQDFGIGFHPKADLPSDVGRTWRIRTTRASLRFHF